MFKTLVCAALVAGLAAPAAHAAVIDFEDSVPVVPVGGNDIGGDRTSGGFNFDSSSDHTHLANNSFLAANGSTYLATDDFQGTQTLTMAPTAGGTFSLAKIDFAEWDSLAAAATSVSVTGNLFGGGTISTTVNLDGIADGVGPLVDFQTHVFNWLNLVSVTFDPDGPAQYDYYAIDNIEVNTVGSVVPLPTAALAGMTLMGGLAATRRRRSA